MQLLPKYTDFLLSESLKYYNGILQEDVYDTVEHIQQNLLPLLRIQKDNVAFIGSAGKLKDAESHNINLAIDLNSLMKNNGLDDAEQVEDFIIAQLKRLKYDYKVLKNSNRIIVDWPISGNSENGNVELHLQLSENLKWIEFARFAPNLNETNSQYTGKHREFFLESIVTSLPKEVLTYYKEDVVKEYSKHELIMDEGLTKVHKTFEGKNGYLKIPRVLDETRRLVTDDPDKFAELVFGEGFKAEDIMTFEQCFEIFESDEFKYSKKREKIKKIFLNKLAGNRMIVPEGLM